MSRLLRSSLLALVPCSLLALACSGSAVTIGELDASTKSDGGTTVTDGAVANSSCKVWIFVRATAASFPHNDGNASLQPTDARLWIRNLAFDFANGPSRTKIFDLAEPKETPINDKSETLVASVPIAGLQTGTAVKAYVGTDAVAYRVPTKLHYNGAVLDGEIKGWQALSNGALDPALQQARASGFFSIDFLVGGNKVASNSGSDAPLPKGPVGGGFELSVDSGVGTYSFPLLLPIGGDLSASCEESSKSHVPCTTNNVCQGTQACGPDAVCRDRCGNDNDCLATDRCLGGVCMMRGHKNMYMTLNVDHNFRWVDQKKADYVDGAWDTEPPGFEQVVRFGANSFTLTLE